MGLGKQAKTLSKGRVEAMLAYLSTTRNPARKVRIRQRPLVGSLRADS